MEKGELQGNYLLFASPKQNHCKRFLKTKAFCCKIEAGTFLLEQLQKEGDHYGYCRAKAFEGFGAAAQLPTH
jgi:hypothetical protein